MAGINDLANIWNNVREFDLRPIRQAAEEPMRITLVGAPGSGKQTLAEQMHRDPLRPAMQTQTPLVIAGLDDKGAVSDAQLVILMVNANAGNFSTEQALARRLSDNKKSFLVFINQSTVVGAGQGWGNWNAWQSGPIISGSVNDTQFLLDKFVPAVMQLLPDHLLALGRQFPIFRVPIARHLISDVCFSNAAYTFSTGVAEIVPIFDIPLNLADIVVLTKAQAFLAYKLGLVFGFSTNWHDYVSEFGGVIGGGFLWRQIARSLIGLVPLWGIVPKVAVAYSGTYVVGNAILQWYLTGRNLTRAQIRVLSKQAFERGKTLARDLLARVPRPRLGRGKGTLPPPLKTLKPCPNCGRPNPEDAAFCQYCGTSLPQPAIGQP
jgi:uncharacterized protein (DUF697 family)